MAKQTKEKTGKKRVFNRISELKCVYCGRGFKSLRSDSLYCSGTCNNYACRDRKKGIIEKKIGSNTSYKTETLKKAAITPFPIKKTLPVRKIGKKSQELVSVTSEYTKIKREIYSLEHTYDGKERLHRMQAEELKPKAEELRKRKKQLFDKWKAANN
jgi:hypothetical protein